MGLKPVVMLSGLLGMTLCHATITFQCRDAQIQLEMQEYLNQLKVNPDWLSIRNTTEEVSYTLKSNSNSLYLKFNSAYGIRPDTVVQNGKVIETVSRKEIFLALTNPARQLILKGPHCSLGVLNEHIELRQNVVSWAQKLEWGWPDGTPARWNKKYWVKGDLVGSDLPAAINDMFISQSKYAIGCYTATKMVYAQAFLDYFNKKRPNPRKLKEVETELMSDNDPLVGIDPPAMWHFEENKAISEFPQKGKLLEIDPVVPSTSFVPGDWVYFLNTDPVSHERTGYEGSNAIYLGGNKFDDYYNDNQHGYTYQEKIDEVYQWRNGVFSMRRHFNKVKPLTSAEKIALDEAPEKGGLLMPYRVVPRFLPFN